MNTIEAINMSTLRANIRCATSQPLTQHVSIAINNIETNIHLQTSRNLNKVKQDVLPIPTQHCCASNGKLKVKKTANKNMMNDLAGEKTKLP
jgi:hypothetical protein